ncbi:MAG: ligand-binding SRPBCC domain-containing protein [Sulfurimonas sp.]|jgi:ligand-binding SRPBCC domain-containing protein|uniref:SRPBCC family protein n=1 Tax=Sulfurimonas sp. TaxID=2022749 RepID=UPI0039E7201C
MKTYEKISLIECKIDELFTFHLDLHNLQAITPNDTKVKLLTEMFTPSKGDIFKIHTVKNFIPMVWEIEIQELTSPNLLVDIALQSPFSFWKHSHIFTDLGSGFCELKDKVEYKAPLGFLGRLFDFVVKYELEKMFSYRHKVTKEMIGIEK